MMVDDYEELADRICNPGEPGSDIYGRPSDTTVCELTDGAIRLEVSPRSMVKDGYDSQMRCAQLRCLVDTGESCWP